MFCFILIDESNINNTFKKIKKRGRIQMKKIVLYGITIIMLFVLAGCGSDNNESAEDIN